MEKKISIFFIGLILSFWTSFALAFDFYVGLDLGAVNLMSSETFLAPFGNLIRVKTDETAVGPIGQLDIGIGWDNYFRLDISGSFDEVNIVGSVISTNAHGDLTSHIETIGVLLNAYLDPLGILGITFGFFSPYIGGGVGYANNHLGNIFNADGSILLPAGAFIGGSNTNNFAYRYLVGFDIAITEYFDLDFSYAYFNTGNAKSDSTITLIDGTQVPFTNNEFYSTPVIYNTFWVGFRWTF